MKTDNRNIFAIKSFLREYLDLRKDKDSDICLFYGIIGIECELYCRNNRCDVDLSVDGAYYGSGAFRWNE